MALTSTSDWARDVRSPLVVIQQGREQLRAAERLVADYVARMALAYANAAGSWDLSDPGQVRTLVRLVLGGVVKERDERRRCGTGSD